MKYATQYVKTAAQFVQDFDGAVPLHHYLKSRFSVEKKYGSKDRRFISHLCYSFFRLGHFLKNIGAEERIKAALFLAGSEQWKVLFAGDWLSNWHNNVDERVTFIEEKYQQEMSSIFPWQDELSEQIDKRAFNLSHLNQPDLYIRIRPAKEQLVEGKLIKAEIPYTRITDSCFAFENGTKLENVLEINKDYVIQDINSQRVGEFMKLKVESGKPKIKVWDCCAASGGKSIMAYDLIPEIKLTVSDIRPSIIHNLNKRLAEAAIQNYHSFVADLSQPINQSTNQLFDLIICDAPCSGSGTWSRTPEQLYFFKEEEITRYRDLQKKITGNVVQSVSKGGHLLYITCSVFRKENEEVVEFIKSQLGLTLVKMELLKGYDKKADTLFAALFRF